MAARAVAQPGYSILHNHWGQESSDAGTWRQLICI